MAKAKLATGKPAKRGRVWTTAQRQAASARARARAAAKGQPVQALSMREILILDIRVTLDGLSDAGVFRVYRGIAGLTG